MANAMGPEGVRVNAISAGPIRTLAASVSKTSAKCWLIAKPLPRFAVPLLLKMWVSSVAFLRLDLSAGISGEWSTLTAVSNIAAMNELELNNRSVGKDGRRLPPVISGYSLFRILVIADRLSPSRLASG